MPMRTTIFRILSKQSNYQLDSLQVDTVCGRIENQTNVNWL